MKGTLVQSELIAQRGNPVDGLQPPLILLLRQRETKLNLNPFSLV
jgi:hypothetical protein